MKTGLVTLWAEVFSLAWLLALTKWFASLDSRMVCFMHPHGGKQTNYATDCQATWTTSQMLKAMQEKPLHAMWGLVDPLQNGLYYCYGALKVLQSLEASFNPLGANTEQQQFSPNNIHTLSRDKVMRINKMITKEKSYDLLSNSLN